MFVWLLKCETILIAINDSFKILILVSGDILRLSKQVALTPAPAPRPGLDTQPTQQTLDIEPMLA